MQKSKQQMDLEDKLDLARTLYGLRERQQRRRFRNEQLELIRTLHTEELQSNGDTSGVDAEAIDKGLASLMQRALPKA